jgi:hypothetical protein
MALWRWHKDWGVTRSIAMVGARSLGVHRNWNWDGAMTDE